MAAAAVATAAAMAAAAVAAAAATPLSCSSFLLFLSHSLSLSLSLSLLFISSRFLACSLRLAIINEDNLNSALDMPCNEMEMLRYMSEEIAAAVAASSDGGLSPENIIAKAKTHFGSKAFPDPDLKSIYNFALRIPGVLVKNLAELHFSMVPAAKLRCPPKVFNTIANIDQNGMHPYSKVASREHKSCNMGRGGGHGHATL